jgi:hypothetical protein
VATAAIKNQTLSLFNELKRRNVFRVTAAYLFTAWLLIQVAETIFPLFGFDDTPARIVVTVLAIGFFPAIIFAWVFKLTQQGLKKESEIDQTRPISPHTVKKLDRMIMLVLALALGFFAIDKFVLSESREAAMLEAARQEGRTEAQVGSYGEKSIAVLPFVNRSALDEDVFFVDGVHDDLLTLLSKLGGLKVISRSSVEKFRNSIVSIPDMAEQLGVATVNWVLKMFLRTLQH